MLQVYPFAWLNLRCLCAFALALPLAGSVHSARAATVFAVTSGPQSSIGGGETFVVMPEDGFDFTGFLDSGSIASFFINDFSSSPDRLVPRWWLLDVASPLGSPLTIGLYPGAIKYPYQPSSSPGLSFEGNGRGNSFATGFFEVFEAVAAADGTILSFAVDFTQYDEGIEDWWNKGGLRINSDWPISWLADLTVDQPPSDDPGDVPPGPNPDGRILFPGDPPMDDVLLVGTPGAPDPLPPDPVPGPLPVASGLVGWRWSRELRRRCRFPHNSSSTSASTSPDRTAFTKDW